MRSTELDIPCLPSSTDIEDAATRCGLTISMRTTLKQFPGCRHWHLTKPPARGTLEVTLWPQRRRLWLRVHERRAAPWIEDAIVAFRQSLV